MKILKGDRMPKVIGVVGTRKRDGPKDFLKVFKKFKSLYIKVIVYVLVYVQKGEIALQLS